MKVIFTFEVSDQVLIANNVTPQDVRKQFGELKAELTEGSPEGTQITLTIDGESESLLGTLIQWVTSLEPIARAHGYHLGITGSCLYGRRDGLEPEDMDILLYWHSSKKPAILPLALLQGPFSLPDARPCSKSKVDNMTREVFVVTIKGIKLDFIFLNA